jgi:hypothetical protein
VNKGILRRLRALEARFPRPAIDLSSVPGAALDALEARLEDVLAAGAVEANWYQQLPSRLQRIFVQTFGRSLSDSMSSALGRGRREARLYDDRS